MSSIQPSYTCEPSINSECSSSPRAFCRTGFLFCARCIRARLCFVQASLPLLFLWSFESIPIAVAVRSGHAVCVIVPLREGSEVSACWMRCLWIRGWLWATQAGWVEKEVPTPTGPSMEILQHSQVDGSLFPRLLSPRKDRELLVSSFSCLDTYICSLLPPPFFGSCRWI